METLEKDTILKKEGKRQATMAPRTGAVFADGFTAYGARYGSSSEPSSG